MIIYQQQRSSNWELHSCTWRVSILKNWLITPNQNKIKETICVVDVDIHITIWIMIDKKYYSAPYEQQEKF